MTWDVSVPAGSDNVRDGDDVIRTFKTDVQTALQSQGNFPIDTSAPKFRYTGGKGNTASRPTNSEGGLYFDTDKNDLLRDNNSSWDRVAISFPSGTKAIFWQGSAPTGWTKDTSALDRFIVNKSGSGGTTGGSWAGTSTSNGAHTHTVAKYYTSGSDEGVYFYTGTYNSSNYLLYYVDGGDIATYSSGFKYESASATTSGTISNGEDFNSSSTGAHTHTFDHTQSEHSFRSVMIAEKD